jgi:hypothetical protein
VPGQSQSRAKRRTTAKDAAEKLPSIDDLLGVSAKAEEEALALQSMSRNLRRLRGLRHDEGLKETDVIPNANPRRTFKEQEAIINRAYRERWKRIEAEGIRANVQAKLDELKHLGG